MGDYGKMGVQGIEVQGRSDENYDPESVYSSSLLARRKDHSFRRIKLGHIDAEVLKWGKSAK